jgi:hypothetical protein
MTSRITLLLFFYLTATAAQALTEQDEAMLTTGMDCYENKELACAREQFEMALGDEKSGMNHAQRNAIKKVLYSIYFRLAQKMVASQSFNGVEEVCDRGIALGVDLGLGESIASRSFHIWYTIALLKKKGEKEGDELADRLQQVHQSLSSIPDQERLSYLQGADSGHALH